MVPWKMQECPSLIAWQLSFKLGLVLGHAERDLKWKK